MKKLFPAFLLLGLAQGIHAQENYVDFETTKHVIFGDSTLMRTGTLDSTEANPAPNIVNLSLNCAKYTRNAAVQYDYLKMHTDAKMSDVTPYATNNAGAPKIKLKVYTSAPVGTVITLQLGIKSVDNYPAGIHSEYMAQTIAQNAWQELTFNFFQIPNGSMAQPTDIDKVVLLFGPNTTSGDVFYFDDLIGPSLTVSGVAEISSNVKLLQNSPNPARENTTISFQTQSSGHVSLKIYDLMGNIVANLVDEDRKAGVHTVSFNTINVAGGVYFYVLKTEGTTRTRKMIIDK